MCGGARRAVVYPRRSPGLSPRVRGSRHHLDRMVRTQGSIPACAGEPRESWSDWPPTAVYPRVCGGALCLLCCHSESPGLSPRVRGSPVGTVTAKSAVGSIPACAGEPAVLVSTPDAHPVYPRVCGGAMGMSTVGDSDLGLSPRVRGSPAHQAHPVPAKGSIPACAGEPPRVSNP